MSDIDKLTQLLLQQAELSAQREERLAGVFTMAARADSGAEATVIGEDSLSSICVEPAQLEPCIGQPFSAVGRHPLTCIGSFQAALELGDRSTTAAVFVIKEMTGLLLSWFDCVALGILPRDFPAQIRCYNKSTRRLPALKLGSRVDIQDPTTGRWNRIGVIVGVGQRRTYLVKTASGRVLVKHPAKIQIWSIFSCYAMFQVCIVSQKTAISDE
ncbi:hypothetical protein FJT64_004924 [Amphibalanus amphitrite]|uniref:Uncharacterized protein n=1 Tax=Amphibalanus amphitrite TaxID=1232801 RepID=A0A6A4W6T1_AMPAM|nr:hypothetical protein FJT64_004924 [Amphibalanus amphitrite]